MISTKQNAAITNGSRRSASAIAMPAINSSSVSGSNIGRRPFASTMSGCPFHPYVAKKSRTCSATIFTFPPVLAFRYSGERSTPVLR